MGAWHKALKLVGGREPVREFFVECGILGCSGDDEHADYGNTKFKAVAWFRQSGWTYNEDGNWLCPYCSKEGE